jgi:hypothetical protein
MRFRETAIKSHRFFRMVFRFWENFVRCILQRECKHAVGMGQPDLRSGVEGVSFGGLSKIGQAELNSRGSHPEEVEAPLQIEFLRLQI